MEEILPTHCYCQYTEEELLPWVRKRYQEHRETIDLLTSTDDFSQKEMISIVALLDVDEATLLAMMKNVPRDDDHIIECRNNARLLLNIL